MFCKFAELSFQKEKAFGIPFLGSMGKAIETFCNFTKLPFETEKAFGIPFIAWMGNALRLYRRDGIYQAESIESVLKFVLGRKQTMLDISYASEIGAKLCVLVATALKQPSYRIFTNYNGVGQRSEKQGKTGSQEACGHLLTYDTGRSQHYQARGRGECTTLGNVSTYTENGFPS